MAVQLDHDQHSRTRSATAAHTDTTTQVAVVVGSVRTDRFCTVPAGWITEHVRRREGLEVDLIDLADHDLPVDVGSTAPEVPETVGRLGERLALADAFIVVTPVYNRSYPASLKNAIDRFYTEWQLKPVGFVSYGGITGGLQAVDALRGVFTEFHAVTLRDSIAFANFWEAFDHDGLPLDAAGTDRLAAGLLDQLAWWATTLREARTARPYPFDTA
ncbi:NADPH-dependent FMN reductase [Georgenia sp. Z1491]|uniref:NADPH-dependent FMN reductase n=1 Tax=Georgenia sp. Z1491 TaxID=3416707 RepID=UPI003CF3F061